MTTDEILALARQALEDDKRATPGPWKVPLQSTAEVHAESGEVADCYGCCRTDKDDSQCLADAEFIASARTREPQLAHWIVAVLAESGIESDAHATPMGGQPGLVHVRLMTGNDGDTSAIITAREARVLATSLLRAAEKAERKK